MRTGLDLAHELGPDAGIRDWFRAMALRRRLAFIDDIAGESLQARIENDRLIAECACHGAEYVDPSDPIFFCLSCGNADQGGKLRPVNFEGVGL
jgi:hypothetical protein